MKPSKKAVAFGEDLGIDTSDLNATQLSDAIDHDVARRVESTPGTLTLSDEDTARIRHVRSNAEGGAKMKELLNKAGIRSGCIIRLLDWPESHESAFRVFLGLSRPYEGWLGARSNTRAETKWIVSWDKDTRTIGDLKIALILPPIEDYMHSTLAVFKMRGAVKRHLDGDGAWSPKQEKDSKSFASRIGSDNILKHEHGNYWNEAAFNKLLKDLLQTLDD